MRFSIYSMAVQFLLCGMVSAAEHTKDTPQVVKKNLKADKAILVDVREVEEWNEGHLADANLWQLSDINDGPSKEDLKKRFGDKTVVYLHCRAGTRALYAAEKLKDKGYDIRPLKQGYAELLKAGFKKAE
ncbi:MAG: rhodanese-like domain-containing protein [Planctomycetaceae bacterium]|nr:rhodanese-like domain-containing protein [Planctomycetaceae bacterium]MDG2388892.1 rhodanese-like domain-containing protein [Planctomycetaceae bacterium]